MIKLENTEVFGWEAAIRGMRNPKNSWTKSDSGFTNISHDDGYAPVVDYVVGSNDHKLAMSLAKGGPVHAKYRRMISVYVDITAPLYWWKEFDTYKVGTVADSCSTMHKIQDKKFTLDDFSHEHLIDDPQLGFSLYDPSGKYTGFDMSPKEVVQFLCNVLNYYRSKFIETKDKTYWWQMIQLLGANYNQKRTIMLNYEVLHNIYTSRKNHKLDEWHVVCEWIKSLPYSEIITLEEPTNA